MSHGAQCYLVSFLKTAERAALPFLCLTALAAGAEEPPPSPSAPAWRAWAGGGLALQSYSLDTPSGNNVKLPLKAGPMLAAGAEHFPEALPSVFLEAERASFSFPAVAGVSTTETSVSQLELRAGARIGLAGGFHVRPAWFWRRREAGETRPIALMTGSVAHGLALEGGFRVQAESVIANEISARIYLPVYSREETQQTGFSQSKLRLGLRYRGTYSLNHGFSMFFAPELQLEQNTYNGTGTRSVRDARERWVTLALPLTLEGNF